MKKTSLLITILFLINFISQAQNLDCLRVFSDAQISIANTAQNTTYLSLQEKNILLILNLARLYPVLFNNEIIDNYNGIVGYPNDFLKNKKYIRSLSKTLLRMDPIKELYPSYNLYLLAYCHAYKSGLKGRVGHKRVGCDKLGQTHSECCSYGLEYALDIVVQLLIDHNIKNLGHRNIMLDANQSILGVSIQPHKGYRVNAVLDFSY